MSTLPLKPLSIWKQMVRTFQKVIAASWDRTVRLVGRSPRQSFEETLIALGKRMYAVGIDDGHLGAQIAALDVQLQQDHPTTTDITGLKAERRTLVMRLAAAARVAILACG